MQIPKEVIQSYKELNDNVDARVGSAKNTPSITQYCNRVTNNISVVDNSTDTRGFWKDISEVRN